jgi:hypothetical protein
MWLVFIFLGVGLTIGTLALLHSRERDRLLRAMIQLRGDNGRSSAVRMLRRYYEVSTGQLMLQVPYNMLILTVFSMPDGWAAQVVVGAIPLDRAVEQVVSLQKVMGSDEQVHEEMKLVAHTSRIPNDI